MYKYIYKYNRKYLCTLDWTHLEPNVGLILLKWIYTGKVLQENLTLDLMKAASNFQLLDLVDQCERYLIGIVGLKDCVQLYAAAEELGAQRLKEHCSSLISAHWVRKVEINIKLYNFNFLLNANYNIHQNFMLLGRFNRRRL